MDMALQSAVKPAPSIDASTRGDARPPRRRGDGDCCAVPSARSANGRGLAWVFGAFVICPCHLPITLTVAAALLGGTGAGIALRSHPVIAGLVITAAWAAATWHGFRLMAPSRT
jgi:MerE protein